METITLGEVGAGIAFLVALIGGVAFLIGKLKTWIAKSLEEQFSAIDRRLDDLKERVEQVDQNATKNFLVRYLADVENGDTIDEIEKERFWEQYKHYKDAGGNSYIKHKVDKLDAEHKL